MKTLKEVYDMLSLRRQEDIFQTLLLELDPGIQSLLKQRDSGLTRIDISICLSGSNTQTLTSVSYSNDPVIGLVKDLRSHTKISARDVEEVYGLE